MYILASDFNNFDTEEGFAHFQMPVYLWEYMICSIPAQEWNKMQSFGGGSN